MTIPAILALLCCGLAFSAPPRLVDAHVHHNGDPAFLQKLVAKLESADGVAFLRKSLEVALFPELIDVRTHLG